MPICSVCMDNSSAQTQALVDYLTTQATADNQCPIKRPSPLSTEKIVKKIIAFLRQGANPNGIDARTGMTILGTAIANYSCNVSHLQKAIETLQTDGVSCALLNFYVCDAQGRMPFFYAHPFDSNIMSFIQEFKIDLEKQDAHGCTLAHYAALIAHLDPPDCQNFVALLSDKSGWYASKPINWNAQDNNGDTPLHYGVRQGNKGFLAAILQKGADHRIQNNVGHTPLWEAQQEENKTCIMKNLAKKYCKPEEHYYSLCHLLEHGEK